MLEYDLEWNPTGEKVAIFLLVSGVNTDQYVFCYLFISSAFQNFILFVDILNIWSFMQ